MTTEKTNIPSPISEVLPRVLNGLPAPNNDKSECTSQSTTQPNSLNSYEGAQSGCVPLATPWQQRRLNLDARPPMVQEMANRVEVWCKNFARHGRDGRSIVLSGQFGCGKTHSFSAARRYVRDVRMEIWPSPKPWAHPPSFYSCNWSDFVRELVEFNNVEMREDLLGSDVVFMDDIGSEEDRFKSGAPTRLLGDILGRLHDERRYVFITTNIAPSAWQERWDGRVEDRLLRMNADIVDLSGCESYAVWRLEHQ